MKDNIEIGLSRSKVVGYAIMMLIFITVFMAVILLAAAEQRSSLEEANQTVQKCDSLQIKPNSIGSISCDIARDKVRNSTVDGHRLAQIFMSHKGELWPTTWVFFLLLFALPVSGFVAALRNKPFLVLSLEGIEVFKGSFPFKTRTQAIKFFDVEETERVKNILYIRSEKEEIEVPLGILDGRDAIEWLIQETCSREKKT